jgi:hypothetical protein
LQWREGYEWWQERNEALQRKKRSEGGKEWGIVEERGGRSEGRKASKRGIERWEVKKEALQRREKGIGGEEEEEWGIGGREKEERGKKWGTAFERDGTEWGRKGMRHRRGRSAEKEWGIEGDEWRRNGMRHRWGRKRRMHEVRKLGGFREREREREEGWKKWASDWRERRMSEGGKEWGIREGGKEWGRGGRNKVLEKG